MKKILLTASLSALAVLGFAQQDPQFTQNMLLKLPVNPGYAGISGAICATAAYRTQWLSFPGAPKTSLFTADMPVNRLSGGAGFTVMKDKLGNFNFTMARAAYSFHRPINGGAGTLGMGIELGALQSSVEYNWMAPNGTNGLQDPAIPNEFLKETTYDVGLGAYYSSQTLHVGISVSHLPGKSEHLTAPDFNYEVARHYYVSAGYDFIPANKLMVRPSVFVKTDASVTAIDFHCDLLYDNYIWGGISYRLQDAIAPMAGVIIHPSGSTVLKIGYSYDIGTSGLKAYHGNTHEFVVNYCIKWKRPIPISTHINYRDMQGKQVY